MGLSVQEKIESTKRNIHALERQIFDSEEAAKIANRVENKAGAARAQSALEIQLKTKAEYEKRLSELETEIQNECEKHNG